MRRKFLINTALLIAGSVVFFNLDISDEEKPSIKGQKNLGDNDYISVTDSFEFPDSLPGNYFRLSSVQGVLQNGGILEGWQASGKLAPSMRVRGSNIVATGNSIEFSGVGGSFIYESASIAGTNDFTIFALFRPDQSTSVESSIITKSLRSSSGLSWRLFSSPYYGVKMGLSSDGRSESPFVVSGLYTPGHELAIVVRKSGGVLSRWINAKRCEDQTASVTLFDNKAPIYIGGRNGSTLANASEAMRGGIKEVGLFDSALTDSQCSDLATFLIRRSQTTKILSWAGEPLVGASFPLQSGNIDVLVATPSGATPTETDLNSHRYRHHTRVAKHDSRLWILYSSGGTNEDASGQMTIAKSSIDNGTTFGSPILLCGPQSEFDGLGASYLEGSRVTYPHCFIVSGGKLYAVIAIDSVAGRNIMNGDALVARECRTDGTVGNLVRISDATYTARSGFEEIPYDPILAAALSREANLFGVWGGSSPGRTSSAWTGWIYQNGNTFAEPSTLQLSENRLLRMWRSIWPPTNRIHIQNSDDDGRTWGPLVETDIPDYPSSTAGVVLTDGRIALVFNPIAKAGQRARDPLLLALFNPSTGVVQSIVSVRKDVSDMPVYPGAYKGGAAAYPGIWQDGTTLFVSSSRAKEDIYLTKVAVPA